MRRREGGREGVKDRGGNWTCLTQHTLTFLPSPSLPPLPSANTLHLPFTSSLPSLPPLPPSLAPTPSSCNQPRSIFTASLSSEPPGWPAGSSGPSTVSAAGTTSTLARSLPPPLPPPLPRTGPIQEEGGEAREEGGWSTSRWIGGS